MDWLVGYMQDNLQYKADEDPLRSFFSHINYLYDKDKLNGAIGFRREHTLRVEDAFDTYLSGRFFYINLNAVLREIKEDMVRKREEFNSESLIRGSLKRFPSLIEESHRTRQFGKLSRYLVFDIEKLNEDNPIVYRELSLLEEKFYEQSNFLT